jgi:hypothetical protein
MAVEIISQTLLVPAVDHTEVTEIVTDTATGRKVREVRFLSAADVPLLTVRIEAADADIDGEGLKVTVPTGVQF